MIINPSDRIGGVKTYYFATKLAEVAEMNANGEQVINLGIGSPDLSPPESVLKTLKLAINAKDANRYQSYRGIPKLREGFAYHYNHMLGVDLNPFTEILPLIGSKEGIMHISMAFLNPGDQVLVPNPGYPSYRATAELAGAKTIFYDLLPANKWLPDLDQLKSLDTSKIKIMWLNYPHMPTGARASKEVFEALVSWAKDAEVLLCHDNPYNFILNEEPMSLLSIPGAKDCALELCSLSKCYNMAGWRVGAVVGDQAYINTILRYKSNMDRGMYRPVQEAAAQALHLDQTWHDELNDIYKERREEVYKIFDLLACDYETSASGLFVWAKVPSYIADVKSYINDILKEARVFITPGSIFGSNGEGYVRIALCSTKEDLKKARKRIETRFVKSIVGA